MTRATVVTSMSREIFEGYGQDFLRTFAQHWPRNVRCVVYTDGPMPYTGKELAERFQFEMTANVLLHDDWMARIAPFPLMRGDLGDGNYSIQFDARQARKAFIEAHATEQFGGKVFWVDADVITHAAVPADFLDKCLPDEKLCCYLGRGDWYYTESGFIGFNADHPGCEQFMAAYRNVFLSGGIFTQQQWHDCIGFDLLRRGLPRKFFTDLAEGLPEGTMHVFVNSILGSVADHKKGGRKKSRSTKEDLVIERSEPYWQFNADA